MLKAVPRKSGNKCGVETVKKLISIIVLLFAISCSGQEMPKASLVDEFGEVTCEDLLARTDNLSIQMANNPTSTALIVIHPQNGTLAKAIHYKEFIEKTFQRHNLDSSRLRIVRGKEKDSVGGSFWLVPRGAENPVNETIVWPEKKLDLSKPFIFDAEDDEGVCPTFSARTYAELIKANPNVRGHIVISPYSRSQQMETASHWLHILRKDYEIPRNRLRVFFTRPTDWSHVEFWIVPIKKK